MRRAQHILRLYETARDYPTLVRPFFSAIANLKSTTARQSTGTSANTNANRFARSWATTSTNNFRMPTVRQPLSVNRIIPRLSTVRLFSTSTTTTTATTAATTAAPKPVSEGIRVDFIPKRVIREREEAILKLLSEHNLTEALESYRQAIKNKIPIRAKAHETFIRMFVKAGDMESARQILNSMLATGVVPTDWTYNALFEGYSKIGDLQSIRGLELQMRANRVRKTQVTYNILIEAFCRAGQYKSALGFYSEMKLGKVPPSIITLHALLRGLSSSNDPDKYRLIVKIFEEIQPQVDILKPITTFNSLASASASATTPASSSEVADRDQQSREANTTITRWSINVVMDAYGKLGQVEPVLKLLDNLVTAGYNCDIFTYNTLIDTFRKNGADPADLKKIFQRMVQQEVQPDVTTYTMLIQLCTQHNDLKSIPELLSHMKEANLAPNEYIYNILMDHFGTKLLDIKTMERFFEAMLNERIEPGLATYTILIDAYGKSRMRDKLQKTIWQMYDVGLRPNQITYTAMINAYSNCGKLHEVFDLVREMHNNGVPINIYTYSSIINALRNGNLHQEAIAIFEELMRQYNAQQQQAQHGTAPQQGQSLRPNEMIYSMVLASLGELNQVDRAISLFKEMKTVMGVKPNVFIYNALLGVLGKNNRLEEMLTVFEVMKKEVEPSGNSYYIVIIELCRNGDTERAEAYFKEMMKTNTLPDKRSLKYLKRQLGYV